MEVAFELERKDDEVYKWARERPDLFVPIDEAIQIEVTAILANYEKLLDTRSGRSSADAFVIALAAIHGCTVVTGEGPTHSEKRPNIPDVCDALGIRSISLTRLIREQGWKY